MENKSDNLETTFKRIIFQGLEKIDIHSVNQREKVYVSAINSLIKVQEKNKTLSEQTKNQQQLLLTQLIEGIETQFLALSNKQNVNASSEVTPEINVNSSNVDAPNPHLNEINNTEKKQSRFTFSRKYKILSIALALVILIGAFVLTTFETPSIKTTSSSSFNLPHTIEADDALLAFVKQTGAVRAELLTTPTPGILYEADLSNFDKKDRLDFIIRGELAKKINAINSAIVVTIHMEKVTPEDVNMNVLVRGVGKVVRKKIDIIDQNTNQYFIVTNPELNGQRRSNFLLRLQLSPKSQKDNKKSAVIIRKIVLSNI